jgi:hypothetical protein
VGVRDRYLYVRAGGAFQGDKPVRYGDVIKGWKWLGERRKENDGVRERERERAILIPRRNEIKRGE